MDLELIEPEYFTLDEFEFLNGRVLKNLPVEYYSFGTPVYDDENHIVNAIIYFHGTGGNFASFRPINSMLEEGQPFDMNKYFFVTLSTLGTPGSSSPSTSGLYGDYPEYGILDMVNFNRAFLEKRFNIVHPLGLIGNSMGGFEAVCWASVYPDTIDFLISLVSSYKVGGQNYIISKVMNDIIESDPDFNNGHPKNNLERSLILSSKAMFSYGFSRQFYMDEAIEDINASMEEFALACAEENVLDAYYRNRASMNYDLTSIVSNITAKTLIVAVYEDQYFPPELDAIPMQTLIKDSKLICFNSYYGHVGASQLDKISYELAEFLSDEEEEENL